MGAWCFVTRQTPQTYLELSRMERDAFVRMATKMREKGW